MTMIGSRTQMRPSFAGLTDFIQPDEYGMGQSIGRAMAQSGDAVRKRGMFDRIGEFLNSDEGRAALLRSGAETMQHGLGSGIMAGANFVDQRHSDERKQSNEDREFGIKDRLAQIQQQSTDQSGEYQRGTLGVDTARLGEEQRAAMAREGLTERGQNVDMRGQDIGLQSDREGHQTQASIAGMNNATERDIAGSRNQLERDSWREDPSHVYAGIGSRAMGSTAVKTKTPAQSNSSLFDPTTWMAPSTPATETVVTTPNLPPAMVAPPPSGDVPEVRYDAQGMAYVKGPDGAPMRAPKYDRR